jgi:DNA-binding phage protein
MVAETRWTPEKVEDFLTHLMLRIHSEFVANARDQRRWNAGVETIANIARDPRKPYVRIE